MRISDWSSDVCSSDLFHFIQNQHQTCKSAVPKNQQQALQEPKRTEVIDITLDAGRALYGRSHVRLPGHPCNQATGQRLVAVGNRTPITTETGAECRRLTFDDA